MITGGQVIAHLIGDYFLQSDWMAINKKESGQEHVCFIHCLLYTLPFIFITQCPVALFAIFASHFILDRWNLTARLSWLKNQIAPKAYRARWEQVRDTGGYNPNRPFAIWVWLYIIMDNSLHLIINALAIKYL